MKMWPDWLIGALVVGGLIGFAAMIAGAAWADRKAKRDVAEGKEPRFSWAWFFFNIYYLAQGTKLFIEECIYERHKGSGPVVFFLLQALAVLALSFGIPAFINQMRWLIYTRGKRK